MKAAMEVQRALEFDPASRPGSKARKATPKFELSFAAFQTRLHDLGVGWLSVEQQRVIFDTIDVDKSGTITEDELKAIEQQRLKLELEREQTLDAEMKARAAAEAEAAERADAEAAQAEAEREA